MPPTEKLISSYAVEMVLISLSAGQQPVDLRLLMYIDTPQAKGKGRDRGMGAPFFPASYRSGGDQGIIRVVKSLFSSHHLPPLEGDGIRGKNF
jgi:hypothetical protein